MATNRTDAIRSQTEVISCFQQRLDRVMDEMKYLQTDIAELRGIMNLDEMEYHSSDRA